MLHSWWWWCFSICIIGSGAEGGYTPDLGGRNDSLDRVRSRVCSTEGRKEKREGGPHSPLIALQPGIGAGSIEAANS